MRYAKDDRRTKNSAISAMKPRVGNSITYAFDGRDLEPRLIARCGRAASQDRQRDSIRSERSRLELIQLVDLGLRRSQRVGDDPAIGASECAFFVEDAAAAVVHDLDPDDGWGITPQLPKLLVAERLERGDERKLQTEFGVTQG